MSGKAFGRIVTVTLILVMGFGVGSIFGLQVGGTIGLTFGAVISMLFLVTREHAVGLPAGVTGLEHSEHVRCIPTGQAANCLVVTDPTSHRVVDVKQCSLFAEGEIACEKSCLQMLNDSK